MTRNIPGLDFQSITSRRSKEPEPEGPTLRPRTRRQAKANSAFHKRLAAMPSAERNVEPLLDELERKRGTWLREVLNACED